MMQMKGLTPLHIAIKHGRYDVVEALVASPKVNRDLPDVSTSRASLRFAVIK